MNLSNNLNTPIKGGTVIIPVLVIEEEITRNISCIVGTVAAIKAHQWVHRTYQRESIFCDPKLRDIRQLSLFD